MNAKDLITIELSLKERIDEYGRALYAERLQRLADETPRIGSDGTMLSEGRTQTAMFLTPYGKVELNVFCGRCRQTGRFEVPFKTRYCRGRRSAMTPLLEHRIATTSCETGSYEKCARVCKAAWLSQRCHELKHSGPSNLIKAISEIELKSIR